MVACSWLRYRGEFGRVGCAWRRSLGVDWTGSFETSSSLCGHRGAGVSEALLRQVAVVLTLSGRVDEIIPAQTDYIIVAGLIFNRCRAEVENDRIILLRDTCQLIFSLNMDSVLCLRQLQLKYHLLGIPGGV